MYGVKTYKTVETKSGPGCNMGSYELSSLRDSYLNTCGYQSGPPEPGSVEGAYCDCGSFSCDLEYPPVSDETAERYFPSK